MEIKKRTSISEFKAQNNIEKLFAISCKETFYKDSDEPRVYLAGSTEFGAPILAWASQKAARKMRESGTMDGLEFLTIQDESGKEYQTLCPKASLPAIAEA